MKAYLGLHIGRLARHHLQTVRAVLANGVRYRIDGDIRREFARTANLRNTKNARKAFVFGNGPSLNILDTGKLASHLRQDFDLITVNNFLYSDMGKELCPTFHLFSDPLDFVDVPADHPRAYRAKTGKEDKQRVIDAGIPFFAPIQYRKHESYEKIYYFNDVENIFSDNVDDVLKPRGYMSWSGMKALAVACYLGYERIYICGMDYDMFRSVRVDRDNRLFREVNHFHDDGARPSYAFLGGNYSMGEFLYMEHLNFQVHEKFKAFPIINLNPEGLIDVFGKHHELDVYRASVSADSSADEAIGNRHLNFVTT